MISFVKKADLFLASGFGMIGISVLSFIAFLDPTGLGGDLNLRETYIIFAQIFLYSTIGAFLTYKGFSFERAQNLPTNYSRIIIYSLIMFMFFLGINIVIHGLL